MGSQITKIPSICGDQYPGIGYQVDCGESVRVAMAWPSASAGGWRSLTMEVPNKLSLETELNGVSMETLLKSAGELFEDNDLDGFRQFEQMLGDKLPGTVVRLFARYAPVDLTHAGNAEACRAEIEEFLGGDIPELSGEDTEKVSGKKCAVLVPVGFDPVAIEIDGGQDIMNQVGGSFDENRAFFATESMEHEGYYSAIDGKPVVSGLPSSLLYGNIVITGFDPETGEDKSLSAGEMMDAMNYFQRDSPRGSGREVALVVQNGLYSELRESLTHDFPSNPDVEVSRDSGESIDDLMAQAVEVAVDGKPSLEIDLDNADR